MFDSDSDPKAIPTEHLEHEITTLAAHIYAATCRWLVLIAEFDRRECHLSWGFHSTTAWLAWTCGLTARAAREHVRVARNLRELPLIRASFARGELSYSKVRAVTRAATAETEAEMLELAHNATAAQLERAVRAYRCAIAVAEKRPPPDTFFAWGWDDDGTLSVRGRLPADQGALLIEAMHHGRRLVYADSRSAVTADGERPGPPETNADALVAVCEAALSSSGTSTGGDRYQVVLHLDTAGRRELEEGSAVSEQTARRMLCDASLVAVARDRSSSPAVGPRTRTIPSALRRELRIRDGGCRFPGCTHARFVDAAPHPPLGRWRRDLGGESGQPLSPPPSADPRGWVLGLARRRSDRLPQAQRLAHPQLARRAPRGSLGAYRNLPQATPPRNR